jgi:peptidoglycan hydrolase-like protein with peptidoglycan-binding domain
VPERRTTARRSAAKASGVAAIAGTAALHLWAFAARRPVDSLAVFGASALSAAIIVNALFLQSGSHPAPFFANPAPPLAADIRSSLGNAPWPRQVDPASTAHPPVNTHSTQPASARRGDPIADLIGSYIGSTARVTAVQRILSQYGYGQIKPSGVIDGPTSAAIEKFERDHQMPVTGRLSDRLLTELAAMIGHPLEVE